MSKTNARILIVEDDIDLAEMLTAYFRLQGYTVDMVTWGQDAIDTAQKTPPDIAVLDVRLPDFDGFELFRQLRQKENTSHIPVIFLSELNNRENQQTALKMGAIAYVTKPFDITDLHTQIKTSLSQAQAKFNAA